MGPCLRDMLGRNQTIEYLQICPFIPTSPCYLSFLTAGLVGNTTLKGLSLFVSLSGTNLELKTLLNVISEKEKLTELKVNFLFNQPCLKQTDWKTQLFYEHGLPLITDMLQSHETIDLLDIACVYLIDCHDDKICLSRAIPLLDFWGTIFLHPTL